MKNGSLLILLLASSTLTYAQLDVHVLLVSGVEDAKNFTESYLQSGFDTSGILLSTGWYNSAESKKLGEFEISLTGSVAALTAHQTQFLLNTADYMQLQFSNGVSQESVASIFGQNNQDVEALITYENSSGNPQNLFIDFPQGISSEAVRYVPLVFPQVSVGFLAGFEFKARYLPALKTDDTTFSMYGIGFQQELSRWLSLLKNLPLHVSIGANYTRFLNEFQLQETSVVEHTDGTLETHLQTYNFHTMVSTKWPIFNLYGGVSYFSVNADVNLLGSYTIVEGINAGQTLDNPYAYNAHASGFCASLGAKLNLGFLRFHADYTVQEFNTISAGISFGI